MLLKELVFDENPWNPHLLCYGGSGTLGAAVPAHYPESTMFTGFPIDDIGAMRGSGKSSIGVTPQDAKHMAILRSKMELDLQRHYEPRTRAGLEKIAHDGFAGQEEAKNLNKVAFSYTKSLPWGNSKYGQTEAGVPLEPSVQKDAKKWNLVDPEDVHAPQYTKYMEDRLKRSPYDLKHTRLRREKGAVFANPLYNANPYIDMHELTADERMYQDYIHRGVLHKPLK